VFASAQDLMPDESQQRAHLRRVHDAIGGYWNVFLEVCNEPFQNGCVPRNLWPTSQPRLCPMAYGDYNPENFDREFTGPIPAEDALFRSRNIPAVSLTRRLAPPGLYGFLKQAGVSLPKPATYYGLALPLGGAEVSMEEMGEKTWPTGHTGAAAESLTASIEPIMVLVMGAVVGGMVICLYLPMFTIYQNIQSG